MKRALIIGIVFLAFLAACDKGDQTSGLTFGNMSPGNESSSVDEFIDLVSQSPNWKIDYVIKLDAADQETTTNVTHYLKDNKIRVDIHDQGMTRQYILEDVTAICQNTQGRWQCQTQEAPDYDFNATARMLKENPQDYSITSEGERTVAGEETSCFRVVNNQSVSHYCLTEDGAPLYVKSEADDFSTELVATSYSTDVSDEDFILPG